MNSVPCAFRGWVAWAAWAWVLVSVCWATEIRGGAKCLGSHLPPPSLFCSGLLAACRISQVIPRALGEAHSGEFLHWPSSCVCPLFWPVFPPPWPVCAPDQSWKLCGRLLRNRVQRSHLLLGVPCVALHFLPTPSSSRKLEPHPAALSQPCAPGATSLPTPLLLPSAVSVVQTPDLPLPSQGV